MDREFQSEAKNSHQRVHTLPEINATIDSLDRVDQVPPKAHKSQTCLVPSVSSIDIQPLFGVRIKLPYLR